jgi:hypothetical protein
MDDAVGAVGCCPFCCRLCAGILPSRLCAGILLAQRVVAVLRPFEVELGIGDGEGIMLVPTEKAFFKSFNHSSKPVSICPHHHDIGNKYFVCCVVQFNPFGGAQHVEIIVKFVVDTFVEDGSRCIEQFPMDSNSLSVL